MRKATNYGVITKVLNLLVESTLEQANSCIDSARTHCNNRDRECKKNYKDNNKEKTSKYGKRLAKENYAKNKAVLDELDIIWICQMTGKTGELVWAHIEGNKYKKNNVGSLMNGSSTRAVLEEILKCALVLQGVNLTYDRPARYKPEGWQNLAQFCNLAEYLDYDANKFRQNVLALHARVRQYLIDNPDC